MTLLREIQNGAIDSSTDIGMVLRRAKVLASRLKNSEFKEWVDHELNGYPDRASVPPYRVVSSSAFGLIRHGLMINQNAPLMTSHLPEKFKHFGGPTSVREPIAEIAATADNAIRGDSLLKIDWPQELAVTFGAKGYNRAECLAAWLVISPTAFVGIIENVRSRLLEFVLQIEAENPNAGEAASNTPPIPDEKLRPIFNTTIYGSVTNLAQNSQNFTQAATVGLSPHEVGKLIRDFTEHLSELNLGPQQAERVKAQIAALKAEHSGKPDAAVVDQSLRTLRNITEGAIASLLATAAQPTVWQWIQKTLERF